MVLQYTSNYQKLLELYDGMGFYQGGQSTPLVTSSVKNKLGNTVPLYFNDNGGASSGNYIRIQPYNSAYFGFNVGPEYNPLFPLRYENGYTIKSSNSNYSYIYSTSYQSRIYLSFGSDNTTPSSSDYTLTNDIYMTSSTSFLTSNVTYYVNYSGSTGKTFITIRNGTSNTVTIGEVGIYVQGYNGGTQALAEASFILIARGAFNNTITLSQGEGVTFDVSCIL